ncbi:stage II sporulation protein M [Salinithrix halophila]|uniref:Stage II sporulation protein M n=1 Tax=Salinithrix halophila TaxID=1485204 RepID=A0ABV8JFU6_9BACL
MLLNVKNGIKMSQNIFVPFFFSLFAGLFYGWIFLEPVEAEIKTIDKIQALYSILVRNITCVGTLVITIFIGTIFIKVFYMVNGLVIGLTISKFQSISYVIMILPHGLVEIPAFLYLGYILLKADHANSFNLTTLKGILGSVFLLILGAVIEAYITPEVVSAIFGS